jgi:glycosyltransferase involved in cell wall biosynthesis
VQFAVLSAGGQERFLDEILSRLASRHKVGIFTLRRRTTHLDHLDSSLVFGRGPFPSNKFARAIIERKRVRDLLHAIKEWSPDILVVNSTDALRYTGWLSVQSDVPTVFYFHEMLTGFERQESKATQIELQMLGNQRNPLLNIYRQYGALGGYKSPDLGQTKLAICVSSAVERTVRRKFPGISTVVIHNGVDHRHFTPTWEDGDYVLNIGRFVREKNLEFLCDVLSGLNLRAILYGSVESREYSSEGQSYYEDLARKAPRNVMLEVHKNQMTLLRRLQACSLFLQPSVNEAFGLTPLEAMACGKVVIAHNSGGTPEVVGDAGFLLGNDQREWKVKIEELMESRSLRKELGVKAERWSRQFTWERTAETIEANLESVAKANNR